MNHGIMLQGSLSKYIEKQPGGVLTEAKTLEFSIQITAAVIYLHGKKIIHRDIKGKNIFIVNKLRLLKCSFYNVELFYLH